MWIFVLVALLVIPTSARAVTISEIMYDPPGADAKHEWIEVVNDGAPTDISLWKVFEGGSNHALEAYAGSGIIATGGYAIIADDPATFAADYPGFSGTIFNVSFASGLNNTNGETITLRDESLTDQDMVTYVPGTGGDGYSLQKISGSWVSALASPGAAGVAGPAPAGSAPSTPGPSAPSANTEPEKETIEVTAGDDRTVVAGAETVYTATVYGTTGAPITNARVTWSFGNGAYLEGRSVLYAYPIPGRYTVTADASSGYLGASDRAVVTVIPAALSIGRVTDEFIEITNGSPVEVDVGLWQIMANGGTFTFPLHTIVLSGQSVAVSNKATGLSPAEGGTVALRYPNGETAAEGVRNKPIFLAAVPRDEPVHASPRTSEPEIAVPEETQLAANVVAVPASSGAWRWYAALGALILTAIGVAYVFARRQKNANVLPSDRGSKIS